MTLWQAINGTQAFGAAGLWLLDRLLPPSCLVCDQPVARQGQLCADCFRKMAFISEPFCLRCAVPFISAAQAGPMRICGVCAEDPPAWRAARAALRYDDLSRQLILQLKHADRVEISPMLAAHMVRAGSALIAGKDNQSTLIVPVPLHRRRLFGRKFNQAALLAGSVARRTGLPYSPDALHRVRATHPLGGQTAKARAASVADAFAINAKCAGLIEGRDIILIDDVLTSGATANECARVLLAGGAGAVDILVAARVPDPRG